MRTAGSRYAKPRAPRGSRGFTLVELMVALVTLAIIMVTIMQIFTNVNNSYAAQTHLSDAQSNLRLTMSQVSTALRTAGGCLPRGERDAADNVQSPIRAAVNNDSSIAAVLDNTDAVQLAWSFGASTYTSAEVTATSITTLDVLSSDGFYDGQIIGLHAVAGGALKRLMTLEVDGAPSSATQLKVKSGASTVVGLAASVATTLFKVPEGSLVCVVASSATELSGEQFQWLYVDANRNLRLAPGATPGAATGLLIAPNVEDLQLRYYIDSNGNNVYSQDATNGEDAVSTLTAETATQVIAVEVGIVFRSAVPDFLFENSGTATFAFGDRNFQPAAGDNYRYRGVESVVRLRNYVPRPL